MNTDYLSQTFLLLGFVLLLVSVLFFSLGYYQFGNLKRMANGLKNANQLQSGRNIFVEGMVTASNQYVTPVLQIPCAAYLWEVYESGRRSKRRFAFGHEGSSFSITTTNGQKLTVAIDHESYGFFASDINLSATNSWIWKNKYIQYSDAITRRLQTFVKSKNVDTTFLGIDLNFIQKEYPFEFGKKYSFFGRLGDNNAITATSTVNLVAYSKNPAAVLKKATLLSMIIQMIGGIITLGIVLAMFKAL